MGLRCEALVLAAGAGRRIGGPKALLEQDGVPLLALHVKRALELGVAHVSAIVRPEVYDVLAPRLAQHGERLRLVAANSDSQASSLALLLRARAELGVERELSFLITPVDVLPCAESTFRALCGALDPLALAASPTYHGSGGHPVLVRSELLAPYLEGPLETVPTLRAVLHGAGARRVRVEVDDAGIRSDLDTPERAEWYGVRVPW